MNGTDDELDDFLRRRQPMFGRNAGDELQPPAELDRLVLRQAREAIESEKPQRVFRAPSWGMPVALAATLVLAFTIILRVGQPAKPVKAEVTVQNVSRQIEDRAAVAAPASASAPETYAPAPTEAPILAEQAASDGAVVVDLAASSADNSALARESKRESSDSRVRRLEKVADAARPAGAPTYATTPMGAAASRTAGDAQNANDGVMINGERIDATRSGELRAQSAAKAEGPKPEWRRDSKSWLAEIERLRAVGDTARADAELAEYKREHRAYAGAPDR